MSCGRIFRIQANRARVAQTMSTISVSTKCNEIETYVLSPHQSHIWNHLLYILFHLTNTMFLLSHSFFLTRHSLQLIVQRIHLWERKEGSNFGRGRREGDEASEDPVDFCEVSSILIPCAKASRLQMDRHTQAHSHIFICTFLRSLSLSVWYS